MKLSLAMIVKNEEEKLSRCLDSIKDYVDEIVIVDTGSTDSSKEIALSYGAKVYDFEWCNDFSKARNFSIEKTTGDYVIVLDADNVVQEFQKEKVMKYIAGKKVLGLAQIVNVFMENGQKVIHKSYAGAIFPREARYVRPVHEHIDFSFRRVNLPIVLFHDGYENRSESKFQRNIAIMEKELENNSDSYLIYKLAIEYEGLKQYGKAEELLEKAYAFTERNLFFFPNLVVDFLSNTIHTKNFEKGLYIIEKEERNFGDFPEFYFVCGRFYMDLVLSNPQKYIRYFNKIEASYQKCLALGENTKYQGVVGMGSFLPMHNLGAFYEAARSIDKAKAMYRASAELGYEPSKSRLDQLNQSFQ